MEKHTLDDYIDFSNTSNLKNVLALLEKMDLVAKATMEHMILHIKKYDKALEDVSKQKWMNFSQVNRTLSACNCTTYYYDIQVQRQGRGRALFCTPRQYLECVLPVLQTVPDGTGKKISKNYDFIFLFLIYGLLITLEGKRLAVTKRWP